MANWAQLPSDIVELITRFLPLKDYVRFGAVCRYWSSVVAEKRQPPAQQLPWLFLGEDITTKTRKFYDLSEQKLYHIDIPEAHETYCSSSCRGWLVTIDQNFSISLLNPFSRARIQLPFLGPYDSAYERDPSSSEYLDEEIQRRLIYKIILSDDPAKSSGYRVAVLYGDTRRLAFWKPGDVVWTKMGLIAGRYEDVIWYKGALYAVTCWNDIFCFDLQEFPPKVKKMEPCLKGFESYITRYLVDFMGDLLLIPRDAYPDDDDDRTRTTHVFVFKLENSAGKWIQLDSVGDYTLFLGRNCAICVFACDFVGCQKNSIYFSDDCDDGLQVYGCEDLVIYSLEDKRIEPYCPAGVVDGTIFRSLWLQPSL